MKTNQINFNSPVNQKVCGKLVNRNIIGGAQTSLIEDLFKLKDEGHDVDVPDSEDRFGPEIFTASLSTGEWSGTDDERTEKIDELREELDDMESLSDEASGDPAYELIEKDIEALEDADGEYPEVYEWWMVNDWFAEKLKAKNEVIVEAYNNTCWGRQSSGQAILLDRVIGEIAFDMEILSGQPNSWAE